MDTEKHRSKSVDHEKNRWLETDQGRDGKDESDERDERDRVPGT